MAITKKMMLDCIKRECKLEIPERKRKGPSHQHPLFAWIKGAPKIQGKSRIQCVLDNQARWPWTTLNSVGYDFKDRITKKRNLSFVQNNLLQIYIQHRFPGRYQWDSSYFPADFYLLAEKNQRIRSAGRATSIFVDECLKEKNLCAYKKMPLRLILSPEFCILINLKFMEYYL
jgi:hypothetical protein